MVIVSGHFILNDERLGSMLSVKIFMSQDSDMSLLSFISGVDTSKIEIKLVQYKEVIKPANEIINKRSKSADLIIPATYSSNPDEAFRPIHDLLRSNARALPFFTPTPPVSATTSSCGKR